MRQPTPQDALYAWYFAALKFGPGSAQAPIHADQPQCGYYRLKIKEKPPLPVYIAMEGPVDAETGELTGDEKMVCFVLASLQDAIARDPHSIWTYIAGQPVAYDYFKQAWESGKWPDEAPGANFQYADTLEGLTDQLDAMIANADSFKKITSQQECDQAANLKDRLLACHKALDAMRRAEKKPHDDAAHAVQSKFLPYMAKAMSAIDGLRMAIAPYLTKAQEAARAAAAEAGGDAAAAALDIKARAGGMAGRRTSTRLSKTAVIVDYEAALGYVKDRDEVKAVVQKVVTALVKAGAKVPGVEIKEETKVV